MESTVVSFSSTGVCCTQLHVVVHKVTETRPGGGGLTGGWTEKSGNVLWGPTQPLDGRQQLPTPAPMAPNVDTEQKWLVLQ